jgi:hypothetical protein
MTEPTEQPPSSLENDNSQDEQLENEPESDYSEEEEVGL